MSDRPRPHSIDAEQSALGAALQNAAAAFEVAERLREDFFFDRRHAEIYAAIADLTASGTSVDMVTASEALRRRGMLEAVGGGRYLNELVTMVPAPAGHPHYIDIVREHATRRKLIETSESIIGKAATGEDEASDVLEFAEREILEIGQSGNRREYSHIKNVLDENFRQMEEHSKLGAGDLTGLATGFKRLDELTFGLQKSDLIILAARPGEGKTSLALNIALNAALKKQAVVMVFSLEMSKESLGQRLLAMQADVDLTQIRNGRALKDTASAARLGEAAQELVETRIVVDDTSSIQISEIKNKCRQLKAKEKRLDLIIVDYLQLMDFGGSGKASSKPENRQQEIATLTRMLKQLARDMECPVLVMSQLSRAIDTRSNKTPVLSDLRESGAIEQDADIVMFIFKEAEKDDGSDPEHDTTRQLFLAKHRNGETGMITIRWLKQFTKFTNYDKATDWLANT